MANTIATPVDTILGEATYGTDQERYADMLGIASVISNRATLGRVTPQEVISAPNQFSAYGKSIPPGAEKYRGMAEKAWGQVQNIGPVTSATYYSTPAAAKNLPSGLQPVERTKGHVYHIDPLNRPIATAKGYIKPTAEAVVAISNRVAQTTKAIASGAIAQVADATVAATKTAAKGFEALAPNGLVGASKVGSFDRSLLDASLDPVMDAIAANPAFAGVGVNSGHRSPVQNAAARGARKSAHLTGRALDLDIRDLSPSARTALLDTAIERGAKGIGLYSSGNTMHIDTRANPAVWSDSYRGIPIEKAPAWAQESLRGMMGAGPYAVTPRTTAPTPSGRATALAEAKAANAKQAAAYSQAANTMGAAGVRNLAGRQSFTAPVEKVERGPSAGYQQAARSMAAAGVRGVGAGPAPAVDPPAAYQEYARSRAAAPASPPASALSPYAPIEKRAAKAVGPTTADLAAAYGLMGSTMKKAGVTGLAGNVPSMQVPEYIEGPTPKRVTIAPSAPATVAPVPRAQAIATPPPTARTARTAANLPSELRQRATAALMGGLVGGIPGAVAAGLIGHQLGKMGNPLGALGNMFGAVPNPTRSNYGSGVAAISDILGGGGTAGATAFSRSTPGYSVTNLGNGWVEKTNQYGVKSYEYTGPNRSLFGEGGLFGGGRGGGGASKAEANRGGGGVTSGGTGLW